MKEIKHRNWSTELDWRSWTFGCGIQWLSWMKEAYVSIGPFSIRWTSFGETVE